jgi:hypothetical protein
VKYPKLAAAIDEALADLVKEYGEEGLMTLMQMMMQPAEEKLPPIPVTKELVLSHQEEVRDAD